MGDGAKRNKGVILCTDSFTFKEVILLINILKIKFDLNCTIHNDANKYRIFINKKNLNKILNEIKPYFDEQIFI
jgi:LAGLIDADG DNA endonuclease family